MKGRFQWWVPVLLALVTVAAFWPALQNGFTDWDDPFYATDQPLIRDLSPAGLSRIFSTFVEGNYHPLTMTSLAVDYHLFHLSPRGWHAVNLGLHVAVTLTVFAFVLLLSGSQWMAAVVALFFGIHPLHVESVAWVSGRKDMLYALCYIGGCITYVLWARRKKGALFAATLILFVLSLLAKGMAATFPFSLLAIDYYLKRKPWKKVMLEKAPFFAIAIAFGVVALVAQSRQGAVQSMGTYAPYERVLFACYGICAYVVRTFAPVHLAAIYPYPLREPGGALPLTYYLAPIGVLALAAGVVLSLRRGRDVAFGALFYVSSLLMVLQLVPVGSAVIADRYTYVSFVGIAFALAGLLRPLLEGAPSRRAAVLAALILAAGAALYATRARCAVWKDNVTLWTDTLARYPNLPLGYTMRARSHMQAGRYDLAMKDAGQAIELDPKQPRALTMRGTMRYMNRDYQGALGDLQASLRLEPDEAVTWNSLGAVHLNLGRRQEAVEDFTKAIQLKPGYAEAYLNRALALSGLSRFQEAMPDFDRSIDMQPQNARAHLWRGEAKFLLGDREGATQDYSRALDLDPRNPSIWYARARAYEKLGRYGDALRDATQAQSLGYPLKSEEMERFRKAAAAAR